MATQVRGSDQLVRAYKAGGFKLDDAFVSEIAKVLKGLRVNDILIKGQPKPDFLRSTFVVEDLAKDGAVVTDLLGILAKRGVGRAGGVRVFPRGIPWPGEFVVDLTIGEHHQV